MGSIRKLYWDSCAFLGLINEEAGKHADCKAVWAEAERGETQIITSFFTFAEVFKAKCEGKAKPLAEAEEDSIAAFSRPREFCLSLWTAALRNLPGA